MSGYYVLQAKWHDWDNWETVPGKYDTVKEAEAARMQRGFPSRFRVAEAYTVTRYKAVKGRERK